MLLIYYVAVRWSPARFNPYTPGGIISERKAKRLPLGDLQEQLGYLRRRIARIDRKYAKGPPSS